MDLCIIFTRCGDLELIRRFGSYTHLNAALGKYGVLTSETTPDDLAGVAPFSIMPGWHGVILNGRADWEAMGGNRRFGLVLATALLVISGSAACGSSSTPTANPPTTRAPVATVMPSSSQPSVAPPAPSPSDSELFDGPGQFTATWQGVKVVNAKCPAAYPTAACYTMTGSAALPNLGPVSLTRTDVVGVGTASPPAGCVNAATAGALTNGTGILSFTASGELCGRRTSFTVASSTGSGSMVGYTLHAVIVNDATNSDAVTENWSGEIVAGR